VQQQFQLHLIKLNSSVLQSHIHVRLFTQGQYASELGSCDKYSMHSSTTRKLFVWL